MNNFSIKDLSSFFLKYIGKEMPNMGELGPVVLTDVRIGSDAVGSLTVDFYFNGVNDSTWHIERGIEWLEKMYTEEEN